MATDLTKKSKDKDDAGFRNTMKSLKSMVTQNKNELSGMDPKIKDKVSQILQIENSAKFQICEHLSMRLDIFSRFAFPVFYIIYLGISFGSLYRSPAIYSICIIFGLLLAVIYGIMKVNDRVKEDQMTYKQATLHYVKMRCCVRMKSSNLDF